jgi:hypothetical protein
LAGSGEGTGGQHLDLLCMSDFGACLDDFLPGFLEFLSEVPELQYLTFDEGVSHLLYRSIDDILVWVSGLKHPLAKGTEGRLRAIAGSSAKLDREHGVAFPHGEVGTWAGVIEYEPYILGFALVVVGVVDGHGDAEPPVGSVLDERWSRVCVSRRVVDYRLIRPCYHYWRRGRLDALRQWWWRRDVVRW